MAASVSLAMSRRLVPATACSRLPMHMHMHTTTRTMSTLPGRMTSSTSLMTTNRQRLSPTYQHQIQHQQRREYLFLPVSWPEFKERFQRWIESPKNRTIKVKLLLQDTQEAISKVSNSYQRGVQRLKSQRIKAVKRRVIRRKQRNIKWKSARDSVMPPYPAETSLSPPPVVPATDIHHATHNTTSVRAPIFQLLSPLPWSDRMRATGDNILGRYQGWKVRRQEQWRHLRLRTKRVTLTEYSKAEWFDDLGRPLTSRDATGRFVNPWQSQSTNGVHSLQTILAWRFERMQRNLSEGGFWNSFIPRLSWTYGDPAPSSTAVSALPTAKQDAIQLTWIGHSTCWVQMGGFTILTDPMFSLRASPFQSIPIGVPRDVPPSHSIDQLVAHTPQNQIDICVMSHDHYDHCDVDTVIELGDKVQLWVVPLGLAKWMSEQCDIDPSKIVELEWWQQTQIQRTPEGGLQVVLDDDDDDDDEVPNGGGVPKDHILITACPAQHWSGRTMSDRNLRLWCSFAMECHGHAKFFFAGDTGYPQFPIFSQIGDAFGSFDLAAIPIGAYEPRYMMKGAHTDPAEGVMIHKKIRSKQSVAIHWGTFALSEESLDDPPKLLERLKQQDEQVLNMHAIVHGATMEVATGVKPVEEHVDSVAPDDNVYLGSATQES
jgi:N-acyl-phosphatidylethanolamine-hydrolysing phospholipase D